MTTNRPRHAGRTALWHCAWLGLGLGLFALLVYAAGVGAILQAFHRLGWLTPLIVAPYLAVYFVDSLGWWWVLSRCLICSGSERPPMPRPGTLFAIRAGGEAVNAITPTAYLGGEPVKAWLLRGDGIPLAPGLASVLVSKTALMLTQGIFVLVGLLVALHHWRPAIWLPLFAFVGLLLGGILAALLIGAQRRGLFCLLLDLSRRWSGREALLASWEADIRSLDQTLREFYDRNSQDFLVCCGLHFLGWMLGCFEVYGALWMLGSPVAFPIALSIEALAGVAKLAAAIVPGSLGVQEGSQVMIFVAFGLGAPLAMTFSLLRRGREVLWIAFGLAVLVRHRGWAWIRRRKRAAEA
jgi:uncharacterized protein (TIRG00374 family)